MSNKWIFFRAHRIGNRDGDPCRLAFHFLKVTIHLSVFPLYKVQIP
jgi:hypothetical protein